MRVYSRGGVAVHTDYRENIVIDPDNPILVWKANRDRLRPSWFPVNVQKDFPRGLPKIGSEHSEDARTWNTFRTLQLSRMIQVVTSIFAPGLDIHKVYFWGHDTDEHSQKIDTEIQEVLNQMEPWGKNGSRQQTEPDVILRSKRHVVMVECKLGKPYQEVKAWQRSRPGMRHEYVTFMENLALKKLFADSFNFSIDGNRFYQLFRNYLLGAALALRWNAHFSLLAIVNELNSNRNGRSHQDEFGAFRAILSEPSNTFILTWQQILDALPIEQNLLGLRQFMARHPLFGVSQMENRFEKNAY